MNYPKTGSIIEVYVNGKPKEGVLGGYNYGVSGVETGFFFEDTPLQSWPIEFMNDDRFLVISEPVDDEEELEEN